MAAAVDDNHKLKHLEFGLRSVPSRPQGTRMKVSGALHTCRRLAFISGSMAILSKQAQSCKHRGKRHALAIHQACSPHTSGR